MEVDIQVTGLGSVCLFSVYLWEFLKIIENLFYINYVKHYNSQKCSENSKIVDLVLKTPFMGLLVCSGLDMFFWHYALCRKCWSMCTICLWIPSRSTSPQYQSVFLRKFSRSHYTTIILSASHCQYHILSFKLCPEKRPLISVTPHLILILHWPG